VVYCLITSTAAADMLLLVETISRLRIDWNERPLTEADFQKLCRRFNVTVQELPLKVGGFYYSMMGRHFIAIDGRLSPQKKLFVMFHEFGHFLLHVPEGPATANYHGIGHRTRKEIEADMFALCALIPRCWVESEDLAELAADAGLELSQVRERIEIFDRFGM
jgi:Zn-dependent peptidase ImmA (M78 family)